MCAVEWKTLDCICSLITKQTGFDYSKTIKPSLSNVNDIGYIPFIQNKDFNGVNINLKTDYYVPKEIAMQFPKILLDDKALLISISGKIGNVGYYELPQISFIGGAICICRLNGDTNGKYLMYYLQSNKGQNYLFSSVKAASHSNITIEDIRKVIIPIPSLAKQQEIVSHLDTFTTLISNLESELDMRRKQYEHYRNQLLDFEGVEIKLLKELATVKRGVRVVKTDLEEFGEIPVYQNSLTPLGYKESNNRNKNTTFVICAGAAGDIGFSDVDFWAADDCSTINCGEWLIDKYIYHFLITKQSFLKSKVRKASVPRLASSFIENLEVPVPSIKTQQEIVEKLDAFENLIQSLEQEIKLRKQQYEYYREKLLTFEKE